MGLKQYYNNLILNCNYFLTFPPKSLRPCGNGVSNMNYITLNPSKIAPFLPRKLETGDIPTEIRQAGFID